VDIKEIKQVIDLMRRYGLTEFELEDQAFKIRLRRDAQEDAPAAKHGTGTPFLVETPMGLGAGTPAVPVAPAVAPSPPTPPPFPPPSAPSTPAFGTSAPPVDEPGVQLIKSPMVGTFYRSPNPEAKVFVEEGTAVEADTVVCIIEAMKLMNEIHAEVKGVITQALVENGKPVEYGQPLFKVKVG
jgi:acetyl-CoA carboxylase biotin carboxyl carrier protein